MSISFTMPQILSSVVVITEYYENYTATGKLSSFGVDLFLSEMGLKKTVKSRELSLLQGRVEDTLRSWALKYERHLDQQHKQSRSASVDEMNETAKLAISSLKGILKHTLDINDEVDWNAIKRKEPFRIESSKLLRGARADYIKFDKFGCPSSFRKKENPSAPTVEAVKSNYGLLSKFFRKKTIQEDYSDQLKKYSAECEKISKENEKREAVFKTLANRFSNEKLVFEMEKQKANDSLEQMKERYLDSDPAAIEEYCELVLSASIYPDYFPKEWELEYRAENKIIVINYTLPAPSEIPTIESYGYVKSRDEITQKKLTAAKHKKLYDSAIYQICIRTLHELFEADTISGIDAVAFNGIVTSVNPATGKSETKTILSVLGEKAQFMEFDLAMVDPKATFKLLKGVSAASLIDITPIPPVIKMDKTDRRLIEGKAVFDELDESINLAAMDWQDFEHLIRELFEKEFSVNGGEVHVTQASSDGGVDAIAFDPDPLRGGKIVIQAKRYTNTVSVAAVRDLYGTVMNEGATKGILVTTSDYGKDSYNFAKDKPLSLLNGSNLLSLLEKHGHQARINVGEAKKILKAD
ncbi:restriction endonuclease [Pontiellaceae bacterium B1224]|nr:restriction endonuclease [Pontiellaceae bacterium B1224]